MIALIFLSIVLFIAGFLMVNFQGNPGPLRQVIFQSVQVIPRSDWHRPIRDDDKSKTDSLSNISTPLAELIEKLEEKKSLIMSSRRKMEMAQLQLEAVESSNIDVTQHFSRILEEITAELRKAEDECKTLHEQIAAYSAKRELSPLRPNFESSATFGSSIAGNSVYSQHQRTLFPTSASMPIDMNRLRK